MEQNNLNKRKLKRKNFFASLGIGVAGFVIMKSFPFRFLIKNNTEPKTEDKIKIKINPLAVSRNKIGNNNGRS